MGTGEPLDNYDNLLIFIRMLTDENGLHISQRNLTVSTCGIVPRIKELAEKKLEITLALSLHAPTQEKRRKLMPVANKYDISEAVGAMKYYQDTTGRRVTFEYSLIKGVSTSCGDDAQMSIAAPSGFAYEWFDKYDNPVPDSIKSEDGRTLLIDPSDTTTYRCHLTYIEEETCGFDLYSSTRPRFPIAEFEWQYEPANCQNRVKFINKSHIMTKFNNVTEHHYDQPCDEYEWDFGNGQVGSEKNPVVIFPNKGGFFNVVLYASIAEGRCVKDTSLIIFLPSIGDKELRIDTTICEGGYIVFGPQYAGEEREYVNVWKTSAGCDSTVYLNLHLSPQSTEQLPDTTICAEIPLTIDGQTYKSHESGKFYRFYTNQYG